MQEFVKAASSISFAGAKVCRGLHLKITLAFVSPRRTRAKSAAAEQLAEEYIARAARLCPAALAGFDTEAQLLAAAERQPGQAAATLLLFDSRGEALTSQAFGATLGRLRDDGTARLLCAIGPADGWSAAALARAARTVSLGRMTLPHELARAVAAEQIYRALTILAGHPYHCGH